MSDLNIAVKSAVQDAQLTEQQTAPLYVNKVTINQNAGDSALFTANSAQNLELSASFYQPLLEPLLEYPLQNTHNIIEKLEEVREKIYKTGLFEKVNLKIDLDNDHRTDNKFVSTMELPTPLSVSTTIDVFPKILNENFLTTSVSSSNLDANHINYNYIKYNVLGKAEKLLLSTGLKYDCNSQSFKTSSIFSQFLFPFPNNPSVNGVIAVNYANRNRLLNDDKHMNISLGIQKNWKSCELFNGLSLTKRSLNGFSKTGVISSYIRDSRKFIGAFPVEGRYVEIDNDLVLTQTHNGSVNVAHATYNKFNIKFDMYKSWFANAISVSLESNMGLISKLGSEHKLFVDNEDKFIFPNLKGFQYQSSSVRDLGVINCKTAISYKLPFKSTASPLRFQTFTNFNQLVNPSTASSGSLKNGLYTAYGWSLIYKTDMADFDLSYSVPVANSESPITAPGFSIGCALSFF